MELRPGARGDLFIERVVVKWCEVLLCMEYGCEAKQKGGVERVLL